MYRLYLAMKERPPDEITPEVISIASGRSELDVAAMGEWLGKYEATSSTIQNAFKKQLEAAAGPWDQEKFEDLLAKWIVATDQPFYTVDDPEFRDFVMYTHHPATLHIPHRNTIKTRVMKMGDDTRNIVKHMFRVCFLISS